jgi:hypothetical protein
VHELVWIKLNESKYTVKHWNLGGAVVIPTTLVCASSMSLAIVGNLKMWTWGELSSIKFIPFSLKVEGGTHTHTHTTC